MRAFLLLSILLFSSGAASAQNTLNLDEHRGDVVILDFWASWCVPCRRSFPWMNEMQEKYREDGLVIIAVNLDRKTENAAKFLAEYPANFRIVYDPEALLAKQHDIETMPSSFVIGRDGELVEGHTGFKVKRQAEYEAVLRTALGLKEQT